jgi:hypothetical protein
MNNIKIDNLSHDMDLDREAMDTITGAWGFSSIKRWAKKTYRNARKAYCRIKKLLCKLRPRNPFVPYPRHCRR